MLRSHVARVLSRWSALKAGRRCRMGLAFGASMQFCEYTAQALYEPLYAANREGEALKCALLQALFCS